MFFVFFHVPAVWCKTKNVEHDRLTTLLTSWTFRIYTSCESIEPVVALLVTTAEQAAVATGACGRVDTT